MRSRMWLGPLILLTFQSVSAAVVDSNDKPLPEVLEIVRLFKGPLSRSKKIPTQRLTSLLEAPELATPQELIMLTQEAFLRPHGAERTDPASVRHYQKLLASLSGLAKKRVHELFKKLGDIDSVYPKEKTFDFILIHGSTVQTMKDRLQFFANAVRDQKIQLNPESQIVFLDGERRLFKAEKEALQKSPEGKSLKDEREAAIWVWKHLGLPKEIRSKVPLFVHAEKKPYSTRATTADCVAKWVRMKHSRSGTALVVSSNPHIYYQLLVTQTLLFKDGLKELRLDALGPAVTLKYSREVELGILLDNLARTLYSYPFPAPK